jgi:3'(2'),5'-bisphosphate nucleotidase
MHRLRASPGISAKILGFRALRAAKFSFQSFKNEIRTALFPPPAARVPTRILVKRQMPDTTHNEFAPSRENLAAIAETFAELAIAAGAAIMRIYGGEANARAKADDSPVCDADVAAEAVILKGLAARLPQIPVVSEEAAAAGARLSPCRSFILVDPLDGTREFLARNGEFTVNLALILDGVPRAGVVYAPALSEIWIAGAEAFSARVSPGDVLPPIERRRRLFVRKAPQGLVALVSRSHNNPAAEAYLARLPIDQRRDAGSSLKFCRIAEGVADVYPRFTPTMEWDTAAGDAVLRAAGGLVLDPTLGPSGAALRYGKFTEGLKNGPFVAWGDLVAAEAFAGAKTA